MKHGGKVLVSLCAGLALCVAANAAADDSLGNPYHGIVERNIFALKPPPPPAPPPDDKPPPVKITLNGVTDILGRKLALMETPPPPAKPGEQAKSKQSLILTIGERQNDIEVLDIDPIAGSVKVNNAGSIVTLTLEKDGPKLASTPPRAAPGAPGKGVPPPPGALPGVNPAAFRTPAGAAVRPNLSFPSRPLRGSSQGAAVPAGSTPGVVAGGRVLPGFNATTARQTPVQTQPRLSPEEQIIAIEANREVTKNQVAAGLLPPLPPTPLTPAGAPGSVVTAPNQTEQNTTPNPVPAPPPLPGRPVLPPMPP